jgi:hypothetical protein
MQPDHQVRVSGEREGGREGGREDQIDPYPRCVPVEVAIVCVALLRDHEHMS